MQNLINLLLYQAGWFAGVLGAALGLAWIGPLTAAMIIGWHLTQAPRPKSASTLVLLSLLVGLLFETLLVQAGWIQYTVSEQAAGLAPAWMVALWGVLATTLNVSLRGLRSRLWLAALCGAIGGPLAYLAGARLGALDLHAGGVLAIGVGWAMLAPLLLLAARRFDGYPRP